MNPFGSPGAVLIVKRNSVDCFVDNNHQTLDLQDNLVANLEVADREKLVSLLGEFGKSLNLQSHPTLIVLTPEVVFQKEIIDGKNQKTEIGDFISKVPLDEKNVVTLQVRQMNGVMVSVTNKEVYSAIVEGLNMSGTQVTGVVPEAAINLYVGDAGFDTKTIANIFSHRYQWLESNFLTDSPVDDGELPNKHGSLNTTLIGIVLIVLIVIVTVMIGYVWWQSSSSQPTGQTITPQIPVTQTPSQTPAAEVGRPTKSDLKIQILNGTGISGQAGMVKEAFLSAGFSTVEVGNVENPASSSATVFLIDSKVDSTLVDEITGVLGRIFMKVATESGQPNAGFDVTVTTGGATLN